jgi:hypothetical protein
VLAVILATTLAGQPEPRVIAVLEGDEFARRGIVADVIERPAGVTNEQFAQQLVDAEGLVPRNGQQMNVPAREGEMGSKAIFSRDGREIIVNYVSSDVRQPGRVCRMRMEQGGMSKPRWDAFRWCASAFGIVLPEGPPPPPLIRSRERRR